MTNQERFQKDILKIVGEQSKKIDEFIAANKSKPSATPEVAKSGLKTGTLRNHKVRCNVQAQFSLSSGPVLQKEIERRTNIMALGIEKLMRTHGAIDLKAQIVVAYE